MHILKMTIEGQIKIPYWTSLAIQWLRLHAPSEGGPGSIPGQGIRSDVPQRRVRMPQL